MASTTLQAISLSRPPQATVGASLHALCVAGKNLVVALWHAAASTGRTQARTRFDEAEDVRAFAASIQKTDPGFAMDLFAAADRHERS
ncbi:MAG: hypothetical protein QE265_04010 [Rhodoferax sp.]|nr:hypothetical protein [Rhodoferax sp.]